eukprot:13512191-Alexandrium_andersonii.AAC.1
MIDWRTGSEEADADLIAQAEALRPNGPQLAAIIQLEATAPDVVRAVEAGRRRLTNRPSRGPTARAIERRPLDLRQRGQERLRGAPTRAP